MREFVGSFKEFISDPQVANLPLETARKWYDTYTRLPSISEKLYNKLHTSELVKTNIKINVSEFKKEIKFYENKFTKWGKKYPKVPRFGIPMVNLTGSLDEDDDPSRQPLDEYFFNLQKVLHDAEIKTKTEICNMKTLEPLKILYPYLIRSSILKWDKGGFFAPHCDVYIPAPNLRLWGTTSNNMELIIDKKIQKDIEPGRIYIIDTAKEHEAKSFENEVYQFFIGLSIDSYDMLKKIRC
jgi:hypothetical protein